MSSETFRKPASSLWLQAAAIILAGIWVYSPALHGTWLWDDDQYITQNPLLRTSAGLAQIWLAPKGVNYFPLTATLQWVQWQLWSNASLGYHWTNLVLHLLSALLLWRLLRRLGVRLAWLGGLVFAVQPQTIESVAWITELKNTLSLPLLLGAMICYVNFDSAREDSVHEGGARCPQRAERRRQLNQRVGDPPWPGFGGLCTALHLYLGSIGLFLAALLSKSTVVMFPFVILLYCWWKRGRLTPADLKATAAFFGLSLCLGAVTLWFEHARAIGLGAAPLEGFFSRSVAAGLAAAFYALKCVLPFGLMPIYPRWTVASPTFLQLLPWPILAVGVAFVWSKRGTWGRPVLFGVGCFLANLVPVLGFVPMAYLRLAWVADHFAYLSLVPIVGLAAAGLSAAKLGKPVTAIVGVALAAVLAFASHRVAGNFRSPEALWTFTLRQNPAAWSAHNDLGSIRYDAGRLPEATAEFAEAVRLNPDYAEARNNLGVALADAGHLAEAVDQYNRALQLKPGYANARCNLGNALLRMGRSAEAVGEYRQALRLKPDFPEAHYNLGLALQAMGRKEEAAEEFDQFRH